MVLTDDKPEAGGILEWYGMGRGVRIVAEWSGEWDESMDGAVWLD